MTEQMKPVDVLAVMEHAAALIYEDGNGFVEAYGDLLDARAAIAELVEAAQRMRDNLRCVLSVNCKCDDEFIASQTAEIDAALAAVKGAASHG